MGKKVKKRELKYYHIHTIDGMYKFFKNDDLRFYMNVLVGETHQAADLSAHHMYNPFIMYLIYKNKIVDSTSLSWYHKNRTTVTSHYTTQQVLAKWNNEHEDEPPLTPKQMIAMIVESHKKWLELDDAKKRPMYMQFGDNIRLDKFFYDFFFEENINLLIIIIIIIILVLLMTIIDLEIPADTKENLENLNEYEMIDYDMEFATNTFNDEENEYENVEYLDEAVDESNDYTMLSTVKKFIDNDKNCTNIMIDKSGNKYYNVEFLDGNSDENLQSDFMDDKLVQKGIKLWFEYFENSKQFTRPSTSNATFQESLFNKSILLKKDSKGEIMFHTSDGYPFWREDLIVPFYGSVSMNSLMDSTNKIRNDNPQCPSTFKVYSQDTYILGDTGLIKFNPLLRLVDYTFQLMDLELWENFQNSAQNRPRNSFPYKVNYNIEAFLQRHPKLFGNNLDRGHMNPYAAACTPNDQNEFQMQANLFPQSSKQNRGRWRACELSITKRMKNKGARFAHITTAVVYARNGDHFIIENEIVMVEWYYKVIFYTKYNGEIIDIECFLMKQYPVLDERVRAVTLFDVESLKNNHLKYLNGHLLKTIDEKILDYHSKPSE